MKGDFPQEFRERIGNQGYIDREALLSALSSNSDVSIRVNRAKWSGYPLGAERVPWCETGYYLEKRPSFTLDPLFHAGCYYVQESSSMFLEQAIRQIKGDSPGLRILDLCAAPGGKTTHLASLAGKGTVIVANEVIRQRASVLAENVVKWGTGNIVVTSSDPIAFARLPGYFDIVLVDAPCSGEGMFRDIHARDEWSLNNCNLCAGRQQRILADVWPALKQGGYLIYSTCTFNPAENELQIAQLTDEFACTPVPLEISSYHGITAVPRKEKIAGYGFHPGKARGEGFFLSVLRKEDATEPFKPVRTSGMKSGKLPGDIISIARSMATVSDEAIDDFSGTIIALPLARQELYQLAANLKIAKAGTALFTRKQGSIIPAHDIAVSALSKRVTFPEVDISYEEAIRFLRNESDIGRQFTENGWILLTYRGIGLGFIKNIGRRLNNYYPSDWRIRMAAGPSQQEII